MKMRKGGTRMYKCLNCGAMMYESELKEVSTTYESYYGVANQFGSSRPLHTTVCPKCNSLDLKQIFSDFDEEEGI